LFLFHGHIFISHFVSVVTLEHSVEKTIEHRRS